MLNRKGGEIMKVKLPRKVSGNELATAIERAAEKIGFSCNLNTEFMFVPDSVKSVPEHYTPILYKKTDLLFGNTEIWVTKPEDHARSPKGLDAFDKYADVEVNCKVPVPIWVSDGRWIFGSLVTSTSDPLYPKKVQPYLTAFVEALYEAIEAMQ